MTRKIFIHGSGHQAASWQDTLTHMACTDDIVCPNLSDLLAGRQVSYDALYAAFADYCNKTAGAVHLCGLSLGGMLALAYALDFPQKVCTLVLIGNPHKIPKLAFGVQNLVFRFLPAAMFEAMAFDKKGTFALGKSMKNVDFSAYLHAIQCPTLILCGEKDRANLASARFLAEHIPYAEMKVVENTGHIVNEENPAALAHLLDEFYALHDRI
ncbi:MAG: alpha/beta hydrolase [Peptococcaceae bacterium]|nr:alpha/beta hydrolase [Peptococcaceae bacterium]